MSVSGVGKGSQTVEWEVTLPVALTNAAGETHLDDFTTPVIPDSAVPGLLGLRSIEAKRGLIDTWSDPPLLICCGPGGYKIELIPGSRQYPLGRAPSGHLILPTSDFDKVDREPGRQPRERALGSTAELMHLPAVMEHAPPLDEHTAATHMG